MEINISRDIYGDIEILNRKYWCIMNIFENDVYYNFPALKKYSQPNWSSGRALDFGVKGPQFDPRWGEAKKIFL